MNISNSNYQVPRPLPLQLATERRFQRPNTPLLLLHLMQVLSPPRPISPDRSLPKISTKTHLQNLNHLLQKQNINQDSRIPSKPAIKVNINQEPPSTSTSSSSNPLLINALSLPSLFDRSGSNDEMSPRSLTRLHRLLSDSHGPSPRKHIASHWRQLHGSNDWQGLLDPLNGDLRRELIRYGDLVQAAYHAFHSSHSLSPSQPRHVSLPDPNYRVVANLFATSSLTLPSWVPGAQHKSAWIGFIAVLDNEREINRIGRRDIVISLRGTSTSHEWAENFRADLVPIEGDDGDKTAKVERGFWSLFKTAGANVPSLSASLVSEVQKLMNQYRNEELSITVTGHSLGAALAVLAADELRDTCAEHVPIAVFSFGGPRVGNQRFVDRVEGRKVKVLRVVNAHDVITRVPVHVMEGYAHVGRELRVDSRVSPYLRQHADPGCCHDLEAYLHLVDGFLGPGRPFRSNAKRSLVRLLHQQGSNLKRKYVRKAKELVVDPTRCNVQGVLASPT